MKRLLVHVGMSKTGSTSIQRMLTRRREALRANGVHVPQAGLNRRGSHHLLRREPHRPWPEHWTLLAQEIRAVAAGAPGAATPGPGRGKPEASQFVISGEDFTLPDYRAVTAARLAELAQREAVEVDIIGYVRPQWQRLEAVYTQRAGPRLRSTFERFTADMLEAGERSELDYNVVFAPYRAAFGARVRVFPLEPPRLPGGLLAHFLGQCGIHDGRALAAGLARANPRRGAKATEVRRLVAVAADRRFKAGLEVPRGVRGMTQLPSLIDDEPFSGFDLAGIRALEAHFAESNARFARDYGIDAGGVLFQSPVDPGVRRPTVARWRDLGAAERRRVRRYVLDRTGIDLDPDAGEPASRRQVRLRVIKGWLSAVVQADPAERVAVLRLWRSEEGGGVPPPNKPPVWHRMRGR